MRSINRKVSSAALSVLWGALVAVGLPAGAEASSREVRYMTFTAKDRHGVYLRDLKREEVSLQVDGQPLEVSYLGYRNVETAFFFLLENSPRTAQFPVSRPQWGQINIIDQVRYALMGGFFQPLVESGPVLLAEFYKELNILQDFTVYDDQLEGALHRMTANFAGFDTENIPVARMIGRAVDSLKARPEKRKILVIFTRTVDRESYGNMVEYEGLLRFSDVELYVVSFAPRSPSGPGYTFEERMNSYFFRRLVGVTGGKAYISGEYAYIDGFMTDLLGSVSNSYTAGFYVYPEGEVGERPVKLTIQRDRISVSHRPTLVF